MIPSLHGASDYGHVFTALTNTGGTSAKNITTVPLFKSGSSIPYTRTFELPLRVIQDIRNRNAVIVVHGIEFNDNHKYDPVLGGRDIGKGSAVPAKCNFAEATAPALCGTASKRRRTEHRRRRALYGDAER